MTSRSRSLNRTGFRLRSRGRKIGHFIRPLGETGAGAEPDGGRGRGGGGREAGRRRVAPEGAGPLRAETAAVRVSQLLGAAPRESGFGIRICSCDSALSLPVLERTDEQIVIWLGDPLSKGCVHQGSCLFAE